MNNEFVNTKNIVKKLKYYEKFMLFVDDYPSISSQEYNTFVESVVKKINDNFGKKVIGDYEKFKLYMIIKESNHIIELFVATLYPNSCFSKKIPFQNIKNINFNNNSNISIEFYVIPYKFKREQKSFDKLFRLLYDDVNNYKNIYDSKYVFLSASNFQNLFLIFSEIVLNNFFTIVMMVFTYLFIAYEIQLQVLEIPIEILSVENLTNIIKAIIIILMPIIVKVISYTIFIIIVETISLTFDTLNQIKLIFFKTSISLMILITMLIIWNSNPIIVKKSDIDINNSVLSLYLENSIYPRIGVSDINNNHQYIILKKERNQFYGYRLSNIFDDINTTAFLQDINESKLGVNLNNYEKIILLIYKHSKYIDNKNIEFLNFNQVSLLNKNRSFKIIENNIKKIMK